MTIKILKETEKEIVGEFEEVKEEIKKDLGLVPEKQNKKYKITSIYPEGNRITLIDSDGNGAMLPVLGNEHLKLNDEIELPE
jgi:hypothetical protein